MPANFPEIADEYCPVFHLASRHDDDTEQQHPTPSTALLWSPVPPAASVAPPLSVSRPAAIGLSSPTAAATALPASSRDRAVRRIHPHPASHALAERVTALEEVAAAYLAV